jgi:hypothetical protein
LPLGLKSSGQHAWSLLLLLSELAHALLAHVVSLLQFLLHGCIVHYHIFARSVHRYHMEVLQFANAGSHPLAAGCSWQKCHHPSDADSVTTTERIEDAAWSVMASLLVSNIIYVKQVTNQHIEHHRGNHQSKNLPLTGLPLCIARSSSFHTAWNRLLDAACCPLTHMPPSGVSSSSKNTCSTSPARTSPAGKGTHRGCIRPQVV